MALRCATFATVLAVLLLLCVAKDEVAIEVLTAPEANCRKAVDGDTLHVHYEGSLDDGTVFDSSYKRDSPIALKLGAHSVIAGWEHGLQGICVGEVRKLVIPPSLGYGNRGAGGVIPPKATLTFRVELAKFGNDPPASSNDDL